MPWFPVCFLTFTDIVFHSSCFSYDEIQQDSRVFIDEIYEILNSIVAKHTL